MLEQQEGAEHAGSVSVSVQLPPRGLAGWLFDMFGVKCDCPEAQGHYSCPYFLNSLTGEDEQDGLIATAVNIGSEKSLFRNTNVEDVVNARKLERELLRDEFQKKKEQDKVQREKEKLAKQERKEKEKKRTQKGERKR